MSNEQSPEKYPFTRLVKESLSSDNMARVFIPLTVIHFLGKVFQFVCTALWMWIAK